MADVAVTSARIVAVQSPAPRALWLSIVDGDDSAVVGQHPKWTDALVRAGGWTDASRHYELGDGRQYVLPLVRRRASRLAPLSGFGPSWGIGGIVGRDLDTSAAAQISADLSELPALWVHVRPNPLQAQAWRGIPSGTATPIARRAHVIELDDDPELATTRFGKNARRNVAKAANKGVEVRTFHGGDQLDVYYDELFLPSVLRWADRQNEPKRLAHFRATRRDPLAKLQALGQALGDSFKLTLAYVDDRPAAGNVVVTGPNSHYTRGAMNELGEATGAAYAAMTHAITTASERGDRWFHMGETGQSEGLARYKEGFGAVGVDYNEFRYERLPFYAVNQAARGVVKRLIRFDEP